ncbi:MAG: hypothetical protein SGPRY_010757 [Prymnesium sp.]
MRHRPSGKAAASKSDDFRRRRLSLADVDTSEFPDANASPNNKKLGNPATPPSLRPRRMSMSPEMDQTPRQDLLPFPLKAVGTYSCHGVEPGSRQGQTNAKINQDRGCVVYPFAKDYALFCVFDGHGVLPVTAVPPLDRQHGDKVSHYAMNLIPTTLEEKLSKGMKEKEALKTSFVKELSGTTAVVLLYKFDETNKVLGKLWAANVGDSRAVLSSQNSKVTDLTIDQKPNSPLEQERIRKAGGFVSPPEEEWGGPARVWLDANMTLPGLAMARSIGDHLVDKVGVVAEPEVSASEAERDVGGIWELEGIAAKSRGVASEKAF